ncbi:MAG: fumarate hydratase C-terminal domain-containing protein [Spirochaetales bacterium]|uniref:Fumarate hydratase C-terminal domain-containing protein n=1 Tax=Candidatus Thalassospirochaeta sargassi TaxID=3119039 RepID=A0AAJ1MID3_9SPIO|nr:fumarate hydratase C-terminal domain-containing protein [Spirochaetales bacterium]
MLYNISTPINKKINGITIGDRVEISGIIYTARDAVMPKLVEFINAERLEELSVNLSGSAIMHTAFSPAGYGPTSSNKEEIESTMGILSKAGVRFHLGKGEIKQNTIDEISEFGSVFIVVPPASALLQNRLVSKRVVAFEEEGMEALHELIVNRLPGVVAAANGMSIFNR